MYEMTLLSIPNSWAALITLLASSSLSSFHHMQSLLDGFFYPYCTYILELALNVFNSTSLFSFLIEILLYAFYIHSLHLCRLVPDICIRILIHFLLNWVFIVLIKTSSFLQFYGCLFKNYIIQGSYVTGKQGISRKNDMCSKIQG